MTLEEASASIAGMIIPFPITIESIVALALLVAAVILVGSIGVGLLGYSPERAENIRSGEAAEHVVVEEIRHLHIRKPERFRHDRVDRHPFYLATHAAAWCYGWCIIGGANITSNLAALSPSTRTAMAICFLVGSTLVLAGSAMGARIRPLQWRFVEGVHENMTSARLSDDIRLPYTFGAAGMFSVGISMAIYSSTSFGSTLGSLGGWITGCSAVACAAMLAVYVLRIRQYSTARDLLIAEAVSNIKLRGSHAVDR